MFCRMCGREIAAQAVACPGCGCNPKDVRGTFCWQCGKSTQPQAVVCTSCGVSLSPPAGIPGLNTPFKSKMVAGLLNLICLLGVPGGIGRLYLGYIGIGLAQLFLSFVCIGYIWSIIDGILILTGSVDRDAEGNVLGP